MKDCGKASRGRYVQGCRCDACRAANRAYERKTRLFGFESGFVDAEPVRAHIERLLAHGYTKREICRISGVNRTTMRAITVKHNRTGKPVEKVNAEAARKIMAIDGRRRLRAAQLVDVRYIRQGLERCLQEGMSVAAVSRVTGIDRQTLDRIRHRRAARCTAKTLHAWVMAEPALRKRKEAGACQATRS